MGKIFAYLRSHRKAVLVVGVLVVASGILFSYFTTKKQGASSRGSFAIADSAAREERLKKLQQDSDNDGLRDWEEVLYRTDPHKPDTDGDGTPDGEEVKLGRDPAVPNTSKDTTQPNDFMATSTPAQDAEQSGQPQNLTKQLAAQIGKEIIVRRIANPDVPFDPESAGQDLIDRFTKSLPSDIPASLTEKDIVIGRDDTNAAIKSYGTELRRIVEAHFKEFIKKPDIQIFSEAMDAQDYGKLRTLDLYLTEYDETIVRLKKLRAPPRLAPLHLEYLNLLVAQADAVRKMRHAEGDLISALVGAKQYIAIQERSQVLLEKFRSEYQKIKT